MSGKMPGSIAPSISACAQARESGLGRTCLRPRVTPTHHALGLFRARLFQRARKRQPVSASLRRAGAARLYERDIAKITSGNLRCVLRPVEAIGGQLRKARDR